MGGQRVGNRQLDARRRGSTDAPAGNTWLKWNSSSAATDSAASIIPSGIRSKASTSVTPRKYAAAGMLKRDRVHQPECAEHAGSLVTRRLRERRHADRQVDRGRDQLRHRFEHGELRHRRHGIH